MIVDFKPSTSKEDSNMVEMYKKLSLAYEAKNQELLKLHQQQEQER